MGKQTVIETKNINKQFPGVKALTDFSFDLRRGEIHCIVGENGAGKSTFIKLLTGALEPTSGELIVEGNSYSSLDPQHSQSLGIQAVYQESVFVQQLSVAENIYLGQERTGKYGFIDYKRMQQEATELMESINISLDPTAALEDVGVSEQQFVKILRALSFDPKVLILDEPTSVFTSQEVEKVLELVTEIAGRGISIIYISHNLKEVSRIAHRITVLRDGHLINVHDNTTEKVELNEITREMVGRSVDLFYQRERVEIGEPVLEVKDLKITEDSTPITFVLYEREILGIAGMVGAGRTEIFRALFGADPRYSGTIIYRGKEYKINTPRDATGIGIGYISEDRMRSGLGLNLNIIQNTTMAGMEDYISPVINLKEEAAEVEKHADRLDIRTPSLYQEAQYLSGGNQQKTVLAKWLFKDSDILIVDEPTQGVDVNAKAEIYGILSELVAEGKSIIMISSDMPELVSMSDRVLVVRNMEIVAEIQGEDVTEENIVSKAIEVE